MLPYISPKNDQHFTSLLKTVYSYLVHIVADYEILLIDHGRCT